MTIGILGKFFGFPDATVLIYDRYGKLLAQLASDERGWDGFYNGNLFVIH